MSIARILGALCLLIAASNASVATARELSQPYFESIAGTESIANGVITAISQDSRGLLWFGTSEGLYSYDGYRFRAFRNQIDDPNSISDDYVRGLMPASDGRMWVASQGGGVSIYDPHSDQFENHRPQAGDPHALPSVASLTLAEAANGDVWVGFGNAGLARWSHATGRYEQVSVESDDAAPLTVRALQFDRAGDLWIGTGDGLRRLRAGTSVAQAVYSQPDVPGSFDRQYVYALFEASDGRIWIGTQSQGAAVLDPRSGTVTRLESGDNATSHPWVSGFVEPTPGRIWIHTYGGGIDVVDSGSDRIVQRIRSDLAVPGGLALDRLTAPFKDRSGLIWVGTWGAGMQRHNPQNALAFRSLRHSSLLQGGLSTSSVLSTLPLDADRVWVGTGGSGIDILDLKLGIVGGHRAHPTRPGALRDGTIRALVRAADGHIWVGTQHAGLQHYLPDLDQFSETVPGIPRGPIRQLLPRRDGTLVIGMQAALVLLDPGSGTVQRMQLAPGQAFTDAVWSLAEDPAGNLWIGTPNALLLWRAQAPYPTTVDSKNVVMRAIADLQIDAGGQLWASGPRGIARLVEWANDQPVFEDYGRKLALLAPQLGQQVVPDRQGRLWNPRVVIDPRKNTFEPIGEADGIDIGSVEIGSGSMGPSGLLFFGGTRGLLIIEPERFVPWRYAPPLLLTAIDIDGESVAPGAGSHAVQLRPGQRRLTVEFAALDYSAPASISYAYRLLGLDEEWIPTEASQRVASYHNLWPGDYQLQMRAQTRNGQIGEVLSMPLSVKAAWWQTPLAAFIAVLLLAALILLAVRLRTVQIGRRAQALEDLVERRTRELSQAKSGAEDALTELKGAQRQLVAAEKMASLGQLVAGVAHEINTPVGVAITAASHLQELAADGSAKLAENKLTRGDLLRWKQEVEDAARLILTSLMRAGTLIASFKQVSVDQSSGQRRRFRLSEFLGEVNTTLLPTLRRSPHPLQVNCDADIELDSYPGALFQILTNLINNALLHAFDDAAPGQMRIDAKAVANQLHLRFSDNGRGMDANIAARAFDPFFTTRRGSGGSGLGLHVTHNLVTQLLGGDIELSTAPGQGAQFLIRIPLQAP
ncbi:MAG TPA: two-component regulator propeller domain-containing protein [Xanthomonadales bacterium]|nr:two-component regulator propeller domain-containing protein [Xanthomonadales bacterium]